MSDPLRVLIVRLGSLGDIVHAMPVAAALRAAWPEARIDWVVDARNRAILELVPVLDRRIALRVTGSTGGLSLTEGIRALRRERYDAALDLQGLLKSAVLARASGARRVLGFTRAHLRERLARPFYSEACDPGGAVHVIHKNLALLAPLGVTADGVEFPLAAVASEAPALVRRSLGIDERAPFALLNPGAAWPNKRWPPERFGGVGGHLRDRYGLRSVALWGPGEEHLARAAAGASGGAAVPAPATRVPDLVALARVAALVVSGDTGPLHVALACGTPGVGLYGPTSPERNGPWRAADVSLSRFNRCQCHHRRRCRAAAWCLDDISVRDTIDAVDRRLASLTFPRDDQR